MISFSVDGQLVDRELDDGPLTARLPPGRPRRSVECGACTVLGDDRLAHGAFRLAEHCRAVVERIDTHAAKMVPVSLMCSQRNPCSPLVRMGLS